MFSAHFPKRQSQKPRELVRSLREVTMLPECISVSVTHPHRTSNVQVWTFLDQHSIVILVEIERGDTLRVAHLAGVLQMF